MAQVGEIASLEVELQKFEALAQDVERQEGEQRGIKTRLRGLETTLVPACRNALQYAMQVRARADDLSSRSAKLRAQLVTAQDRLKDAGAEALAAAEELNVPLRALEAHQFKIAGVDPYRAVEGVRERLRKLGRKTQGSATPIVTAEVTVKPVAFRMVQDVEGVAVVGFGGSFDDEQTLGWLTIDGTLQLEPLDPEIATRMGFQLDSDNRLRVLR